MGEFAQAVRSQASPRGVDQQIDIDNQATPDIVAPLSDTVGADALGSTLNQTPQVQRLANLEGAMNAGPRGSELVQLRASLNPSPTGVVQRAEDADLSNDEWLAKWYAKTPEEKKMTAARKYTQILNTVLNEKKAKKGNIEQRINSVDWSDMRGALMSAIVSFQMHIAPYRPVGGQGYDRNMRGDVGGFYFRSNEHRYKDIYKRIAKLIPEVAKALEENENLEIVAPMNPKLIEDLLPLAPAKADVRSLSKVGDVDLFETVKTYKQFPSLGVTQNNFTLLDKAQDLLDQNKETLKEDKVLYALLLADREGVSRDEEGTGRNLMQGDAEVTAQQILPELMQNLKEMSAPANNESFHDFMLRERGDTVDRLSAMVNTSSVSNRYQAVGAEKHPSLILHELGTAPLGKRKQKTKVREMETAFIDSFNASGGEDPWQVKVAKRGSFGFARPTLSPVGQSERFWPGYAPDTLLAAGMRSALGIKDTEPQLPPGNESGSPPVHVEALKAAVRHALIVLDRGGLSKPESGGSSDDSTAGLRDWLLTRLTINLKKAQHLLTLFQDHVTRPEVSPDMMSLDSEPKATGEPFNLAQHYLKSAEVIERLQEYAFQFTALTFWEKGEASGEAKEADTKEADPYEKYLSTAEFVGGKQHRTIYLDSGMQALNVAGLLARHIKAKAQKAKTATKIPLTESHAYFELAKVRTHTGLNVLRSNASKKSASAALKGAVSADLSPVLVEPLDEKMPQRLSSMAQGDDIKEKITGDSIAILDITNSPLHDINNLIVKKSGETRADNFILAESLTKHSQLGADKYTMGRLVVVGSDSFVTEAEQFLQPFAKAAHHALLQEFRRNMDEVLYGNTAVELSEGWSKNFAERAKTYTPFMAEMGLKKPWADATGLEALDASSAMEVEEKKSTPGKADPRAGWKLLRQAFDQYVKLVAEAKGPTSPTLEAAFQSLPLSDQNELSGRVERKLLPGEAKKIVSFDSLKTANVTSTGIQNLGNSCYLAAGLNMLAFSDYFDVFDSNVASVDEDHTALKLTIADTLRDIRLGNLISGLRIAGLLAALNNLGLLPPPSAYAARRGTLSTQAQQDPNEVFFRNILEYFSHDFAVFRLRQTYRTDIPNSDENPIVGGDPDEFSSLDQGEGFDTTHDDLAIDLPITGVQSLHQALLQYVQPEKLTDVNYVKGVGDQRIVRKGPGSRTIGFAGLTPQALTISLKRWKPDRSKDEHRVDMPERFVLNNSVYRLDTVVYHLGGAATSGHYTASTRARNDGGAWQYRDDRKVADDLSFATRSKFGYLYTYSLERAATALDTGMLDIGHPQGFVPPVNILDPNADEGMEMDETQESTSTPRNTETEGELRKSANRGGENKRKRKSNPPKEKAEQAPNTTAKKNRAKKQKIRK